jgi:recombination protein RecT
MANNNQIVPMQNMTPEIQEAFAPAVISVIKNSFAPNATETEFLLFAHKAASYNLDPFKNEIFFIKYGNTARIQFAAEAYLAKAREKEGFQPPQTQMIHENDEFEMEMNQEGDMVVVKHKIKPPRGKIIAAYCIAHRTGYKPVTVIMDLEEIAHMFTGQNKENWNKWTSDMFGKHVQQRALKKQYGLEFDDETLPTSEGESGIPEYKPGERKDITPKTEVIDQQPQSMLDPEEEAKNAAKQEMKAKFKKLGITTKAAKSEWLERNAPGLGQDPSSQQIQKVLDIMDMEIDLREAQKADAIDADELD